MDDRISDNGIRINKYLSSAGFCSRREADRLVESGAVMVDGIIAGNGTKVCTTQQVTVNGQSVAMNTHERKVYALYKPAGYISSLSDEQGMGIGSLITTNVRVYPVGRLDKDSEGLMLLTNDGELMNSILKAANGHEKEYLVTTDIVVTEAFLHKLENGVPITNGATGKKVITARCQTTWVDEHNFKITIIQGMNRQIRRMCGYCGYKVVNLKRIRIMNITLKGLHCGEMCEITGDRLNELKNMLRQR